MSSRNSRSKGKSKEEEDDYDDFFDSPRKDSPEPRYSSKNSSQRRDSRSPQRSRSSSYNSDNSDSYSDDSRSRSRSPSSERSTERSTGSRGKKNVRKIEARLPSAKTHTATFSMSESRDYDSDHSDPGRRDEPRGKGDRGGREGKKDRPTSAHPSKGDKRRSRSYSGSYSDTSSSDTSTGSDVTDVSPLNSPHSASRTDFRFSGNKPPKSPSRRPISAHSSGSTNRDALLAANKDSVDMNLLMQAILEMEQTRTRDHKEVHTKKTLQGLMFAPPPKARAQQKKNFSFDNDKVRSIDRENQRLMQNILRHAQDAKKAKQKARAVKKTEPLRPSRMTTSAINRMKEQQRIEQENRAMLRRLQDAKACKELRRDVLVDDFNRSMTGYGFATPNLKSRSVTSASPYEIEGSVASGYSYASRTKSDAGSVASGGRRRPQSAKVTTRPHSATFRPASGKQRPLSATSGSSRKARPKWEDGW